MKAHKVILADCSPQTNTPTLMFELNGSSSDDRKTQCALYQIENLVSPPFKTATLVESETIEGQIGEGCKHKDEWDYQQVLLKKKDLPPNLSS